MNGRVKFYLFALRMSGGVRWQKVLQELSDGEGVWSFSGIIERPILPGESPHSLV